MAKFLEYHPDQAYLLPPSVRDVLGPKHLCFYIRKVLAKLNLSAFREEYGVEGGPAYAPESLVAVWLYAYALGVTSSRRLEQRLREDLAFRYLAAGATPDHWTLNDFRRRHARGLNSTPPPRQAASAEARGGWRRGRNGLGCGLGRFGGEMGTADVGDNYCHNDDRHNVEAVGAHKNGC